MNIDLIEGPLQFAGKKFTHLIRLLLPSLSEGGILVTLKAAGGIPGRLAMPKKKNYRQYRKTYEELQQQRP